MGVLGLFSIALFISYDHQWRAFSAPIPWCRTHSFQGLCLAPGKPRLLCWGLKGHSFLAWMIMDSRGGALTWCQKEHFIFFNHILTSCTGLSWQHCRWSLAYLVAVLRLRWHSWDPPGVSPLLRTAGTKWPSREESLTGPGVAEETARFLLFFFTPLLPLLKL